MSADETELTAEQRAVKERFETQRGFWSDLLEDILALDHEFLDKFRAISAHPWTEGSLDPVVRELVYVANDCSTNHMYRDGTRVHVGNALEYGATVDEILEVFQLASVVGFNAIREAAPIVAEELGTPEGVDGGECNAAIERAENRLGYRDAFPTEIAELDESFLQKCVDYEAHPWEEGPLDPKVKALVLLAVNVATTTLYGDAIRTYVRAAHRHGATRAEIVEVVQLSSVVGFHSVTDSLPILLDEARKRQRL